jgi:hypothetical protein
LPRWCGRGNRYWNLGRGPTSDRQAGNDHPCLGKRAAHDRSCSSRRGAGHGRRDGDRRGRRLGLGRGLGSTPKGTRGDNDDRRRPHEQTHPPRLHFPATIVAHRAQIAPTAHPTATSVGKWSPAPTRLSVMTAPKPAATARYLPPTENVMALAHAACRDGNDRSGSWSIDVDRANSSRPNGRLRRNRELSTWTAPSVKASERHSRPAWAGRARATAMATDIAATAISARVATSLATTSHRVCSVPPTTSPAVQRSNARIPRTVVVQFIPRSVLPCSSPCPPLGVEVG